MNKIITNVVSQGLPLKSNLKIGNRCDGYPASVCSQQLWDRDEAGMGLDFNLAEYNKCMNTC